MPQDTQRTAALLESLLSGDGLSPDELDDLLRCKVEEDLHLEYKHGDVLRKPGQEPHRMIREYVSGFANGAGGVLLVGVNEANWQVTGCTAPTGGDIVRWASSCISPISGFLAPPPRYDTVDYAGGKKVLVVTTGRSPVLVPCYEAPQRPVYFLRMDDKTLAADEYLVADLILGRRQHAYLTIAGVKAWGGGRETEPQGHYDWWFKLGFTIENQGLSRAENVMLGVVNLSGRRASPTVPVGSHLLRHITVARPGGDKYKGSTQDLCHHTCAFPAPTPFEVQVVSTNGLVSAPLAWNNAFYTPYLWKAAVYVTAENTPPAWYQLSIAIDSPLLKHLESDKTVSSQGPFLRIERVATGRPIVGWVGDNI